MTRLRASVNGVKLGNLTLYTVEDLSKVLGVQISTIRALLRSGKLKGRKIAKRWYVTEDNIRTFFAEADTYSEDETTETAEADS